ncbi:hypothetical protein FANTH_6312 [Fusarium anthophilum]|uniref:NACHT domain-containing protein n=1 Tax=Fusarium anthophilum TaxID=48485 RepID=A0A8H4ZKL4_9HYPO|nr:hypothetical protein FANTH_6312 [Fusarium anthophilum]
MALALPQSSAVTLVKTDDGLERALQAFRSVLTEGQRKDLDAIKDVPDTNAVLTFTAELDAKRRTIKGQSIASRLYSILQCVRDFSSVVETFVSSNPQIAALVWGSMKLTMMEGHSQLYNSLWQSLEKEFAPDMEEIKNRRDHVNRELDLARTQAALRSQQLQLNEQTEASSFRDTMRRVTSQTNNTTKDLSEMIEKQRARERRKLLLSALSSHDHISPHRQNCKKRHGDTLQWFFQLPELHRWMAGDSQILWCSGKIGSGKTILASSVVNYILTEKKTPRELITFFFARFDNQNSLKSETILRSIVRQAIESASMIDDTLPLLETLISLDGLAANTLKRLVTKIAKEVDKLYIIIDGLDECEPVERRDLLNTLASLVALNGGIKLFLSTRDTVANEIRRAFASCEHVSIGRSTVQSDISAYVVSTIDTLLANDDLVVTDPSLIDDIKKALIDNSDGMFLWAAFQLREISSKANDEEIRKSLSRESLPKDLTETFNRALHRVVSSGKGAIVQKLLPWVTAAARPMTLDELQESAMIEICQVSSMPERKVNGIHRLSSWFQGLVDVDEETRSVSFAHVSIRHFFLGEVDPNLKLFSVDLDEADHYLGEICSTYLFFSDFQTALARRERPKPTIQPMDLARRAIADNWKLGHDLFQRSDRRTRSTSSTAVPVGMDVSKTLELYTRGDEDPGFERFQDSHLFLAYASSNCFFHTKAFSESKSRTWPLFHRILQHGHKLVMLPWTSGLGQDLDDLAMIDWVCAVAHAPLIQFISGRSARWRNKKKMLPPHVAEAFELPTVWNIYEDWTFLTDSGRVELAWNISCRGQKDALRILLNSVTGVHKEEVQELSLFVSAVSGHIKIVEILLPQVFNSRIGASYGFAGAALLGDFVITKMFMVAWSRYNGTNDCIEPALLTAIKNGKPELIKLFLDEFVSIAPSSWQKARLVALSYGRDQVVESIDQLEAELGDQLLGV